jgi:hypothetical protein
MRTVDNHTRPQGQRFLLAAALGALVVLAPRTAQAQDVIHACYVPASGTIYRIKASDVTETCKSPQHIEFHWNVEGPAGADGADGVSGYEVLSETVPLTSAGIGKVLPCPAGKRVLGGGFSILDPGVKRYAHVSQPFQSPLVSGWAVSVFEDSDSAPGATLTVYASCAIVTP